MMSSAASSPENPAPESADVDVRNGINVARRWWWLVLLCVIAAVALTIGRSSTQSTRWQASTTVYLGQPVSQTGTLLNTVSSKAATAIETATGDESLHAAAAAAGVKPSRLRGNVVVTAVATPLASKLQNPPALMKIVVRDESALVATRAATAIATKLVDATNAYADAKTKDLEKRVADADESVKALVEEQQLAAKQAAKGGSDAATWAVLLSSLAREGAMTRQDAQEARGMLALTREIETSRIVSAPKAVKITTTSGKNGVLFAAFLGLLVGLGAAWLANRIWPPKTPH